VTALLTILAATEGHAEEATGIGALGLDPLAILAQAVTFLVLFWVVKKFALDKIVQSLEDRRKTIDKGVRLGLEMQEEKDRLDQSVEKELHKARLEADKILAGAHEEAGNIIGRAEDAAGTKVEALIADAHSRIEDDVRKAKKELEQEVVSLVADATEAIIGEKLDAKKDEALIKRMLSGAKGE
jgi:F-type H+-transporting ATPase subunit b